MFDDSRERLEQTRQAIETYLTQLRLKIHPIKSQIVATQHGVAFLGFRIFPTHIRVQNANIRRGRKRLRKLQKSYARGEISARIIDQSIQSWVAHLDHADTWQLRKRIFTDLVFARQ